MGEISPLFPLVNWVIAMLGFRFLRVPPTTFVMQYKASKLVRQGAGLSFIYFSPTSTILQIPQSSIDVPYVFEEVSADLQEVTVQGELTYRISNPLQISALLDYSVDHHGNYVTDDPEKLSERLVRETRMIARSLTQQLSVKELLVSSDRLVHTLVDGLQASKSVGELGVDVLTVNIASIRGTPELTKAMQAETRELLLQRADEAVSTRRNAAVEQERLIKENELQTDIAVEEQRSALVAQKVANQRKEAEANADVLRAMLEPIKQVDWHQLMALSAGSADARTLVAMAFRDLADNAKRIGRLNISPDLLDSLLSSKDASD